MHLSRTNTHPYIHIYILHTPPPCTGFNMSRFIRTHAAYLEEKIAAVRELHVDYVREAGKTPVPMGKMSTEELLNTVKVLQVQMDHLLDNEVCAEKGEKDRDDDWLMI